MQIKYTVHSTYPPALVHYPQGYARIHAGTISQLWAGSTLIPHDQPLPRGTERSQITWVAPSKNEAQPIVKKVQGSRGATYTVKVYPGGRAECSCSGFQYRRRCKHIGG